MANNEFTVACLLTDASVKLLQDNISFLEKNNLPHISLFQFKSFDNEFISHLEKYLTTLVIPGSFPTNGISLVENNIFLNIYDDSSLQIASDRLAEFYFAYCKDKIPLSQINFATLKSVQASLVQKYGIHWIKENFNPHITLAYEKQIPNDLHFAPPLFVNICHPCIYPIDDVGRIL